MDRFLLQHLLKRRVRIVNWEFANKSPRLGIREPRDRILARCQNIAAIRGECQRLRPYRYSQVDAFALRLQPVYPPGLRSSVRPQTLVHRSQ